MGAILRLSEHDVTFWTFILSMVAFLTLAFTIMSFKKSLAASHYTEIDRMYFELLKNALDKPHLNNPGTIRTKVQKQEYEIYAFMVWNFVEAIYDRCQRDKQLIATWYPAIDAENRRHRKWFDRPENRHKFKDEFRDFIRHGSFIRRI